MSKFIITLPGTINKVGLGQNVIFWSDFLTQHNISQQRLHMYNLCKTETSWSLEISRVNTEHGLRSLKKPYFLRL